MSWVSFCRDSRWFAGFGLDRVGIQDGLAHVAKMLVQGVDQHMDGGGLPGSGEDKGLVAVVSILLQILDHRLDPVFMGTCLWTTGNHPKACGQVPGQAFDVLGRQSKAMIRLGAGPGDAGFNDVQPVHLGLGGVVFRGPDPGRDAKSAT